MPIVSGRLLAAVGEDRSSATIARVIQNVRPMMEGVEVVGVSAFPTSLPFYLRQSSGTARDCDRARADEQLRDGLPGTVPP